MMPNPKNLPATGVDVDNLDVPREPEELRREIAEAIETRVEKARQFDERLIYYVYQHLDEKNRCRYIGKGKDTRAWCFSKRNFIWQRVFPAGKKPTVEMIAQNLSEKEALELEIWCIAEAKKAKYNLCNLTRGGESYVHTDESESKRRDSLRRAAQDPAIKEKRRLSVKKALARPEVKFRQSIAIKKAVSSQKTIEKRKKTNSLPAVRQRRSDATKSFMQRPETKAKIKAAKNTPEYKEKLSKRIKAMWADPEFRKKMSEKYSSPDAVKKRSDASKNNWKKRKHEEI